MYTEYKYIILFKCRVHISQQINKVFIRPTLKGKNKNLKLLFQFSPNGH